MNFDRDKRKEKVVPDPPGHHRENPGKRPFSRPTWKNFRKFNNLWIRRTFSEEDVSDGVFRKIKPPSHRKNRRKKGSPFRGSLEIRKVQEGLIIPIRPFR
jgi:hypothetical protein